MGSKEGKKQIGITFGNAVMIILLLVVGVMSYVAFTFYMDKTKLKEENDKLNKRLESIEQSQKKNEYDAKDFVDDFEGNKKTTNEISNTTSANTTETNVSTSKSDFTESEVKSTAQHYLDIMGAAEGSPRQVLVELKLLSSAIGKNEVAEDSYVSTDVRYTDFESQMLKIMTKEVFEEKFASKYKDVNGYVRYFNGGATGTKIRVDSVELVGNNKYKVNATDIIDETENTTAPLKYEITVEKYEGCCVISSIK